LNIKKYIFLLLLLLPLTGGGDIREGTLPVVTAEENRYVSLYDILKFFPMEGSYDIMLQRGKLYYKGHVAVYRTGHCYLSLMETCTGKTTRFSV
jgi:hypothetical protein